MSQEHPRFHVVIPCAGTGSRAGVDIPKQYALLAGIPMVMHTLKAFSGVAGLGHALLVVSPQDTYMSELLIQYPQPAFQCVPRGGTTRAQSVLGGLRSLQERGSDPMDWVLVHDSARCLITSRLIQALLQACAQDPTGGLLALPLPDTLKASVGDRVSATLSRSDKWLAQTPQMFRLGALTQALEQPTENITDEASAMEAKGHTPLLVEGASFNFKVTYPQDWALAESVLNDRQHRPGVLS
jgi:2-C-methyl-D-erythritol 4-phosphate cytidylyltransferase